MIEIKWLFKVLLIGHLLLLKVSSIYPQIQSRIVGGTPTTIHQVPYLVQLLGNKDKFLCGGSLVSERFVLTAAHCVEKRPRKLTIKAGASKLHGIGRRSSVKKIMFPKLFDKITLHMDVALLKLRTLVRGPGIQPIGLCNTSLNSGDFVKVSGWGAINVYNDKLSNRVRTVTLKVIEKSKCLLQYRNIFNLTDSMFCASIPGYKDACKGDSGGPAVINGKLCGVVSFGTNCASLQLPGVYSKVMELRKFIINRMRK